MTNGENCLSHATLGKHQEIRYGVVTCVVMCEVDSSLIQRLVQLMPRTVGVVQRRVWQLVDARCAGASIVIGVVSQT